MDEVKATPLRTKNGVAFVRESDCDLKVHYINRLHAAPGRSRGNALPLSILQMTCWHAVGFS